MSDNIGSKPEPENIGILFLSVILHEIRQLPVF